MGDLTLWATGGRSPDRLSGLSNRREDHGRVSIKLPTIPVYWSVLSLLPSSRVMLCFLFRNLPILSC